MITVIHDHRRYRECLARISYLLSLEVLTPEEEAELELRGLLADDYDSRHWPIGMSSGR